MTVHVIIVVYVIFLWVADRCKYLCRYSHVIFITLYK